ncbi:MAG: class I SAM-dependent DNA methyltransferase [Chloroflexi bacterium]|nr:class I SAM-dependent DNA methyltransferase [Chloroflexota bacterium]MDL1884651.1 class I SAM-dependent DNA methyltransferase [Anaerolineae bacterium CFX8]
MQAFVDYCKTYLRGDERGEAQVFLDRLFVAFGYAGALEAGGVFEDRVKRQKDGRTSVAFADFVIPKRVLIEMKKRGEDLRQHYNQALDYWIDLADKRPQYVILCNFDEFWIYDFNHQPRDPMDKVRVADLPERWGPLAFLFPRPETPIFDYDRVAVTQEAAFSLSRVFQSLLRPIGQRRLDRETAQRFILQCMMALFAEDIGLLPRYVFTQIIEDCQQGASSYDLMTLLFHAMNRPGQERAGRFYGVDYFDGGLFARIDPVELTTEELRLLREAARQDWAKIHPGIFGTIFEQSMDAAERHQIGGHYTSETDILRIVRPVITRPWRERIAAASSAADLRALQEELRHYRVLDPACGSGNFLYVAYREMKALEHEILLRLQEQNGGQLEMGFVTARQFYGFDIKPFAVELAKATLMIARKLAIDEAHSAENPLPLDNLDDNIRCADALFEPWPDFDACIGNPPYLGAKRLKQEHSAEYVNRVRAAFPDVPGNADYCVYWFRKAHEVMKPGTRAGLVGTNTIRQNYSRIGGLDYVTANDGHIFEAVSSMPWSGEAKVHVSIACWEKALTPQPADAGDAGTRSIVSAAGRTPRLWLDGDTMIEVPAINSSLSVKTDVSAAQTLACNTEPKRVFQGQIPGHAAFVLSPDEARDMIKRDPMSKQVLFPFLIGRDLIAVSSSKPSRYVIDLNAFDMIEAQQFKAAFKHIQETVLPIREAKAVEEAEKNRKALADDPNAKINHHHEMFLRQWWKHSYGRHDMLEEMVALSRFIGCSQVTKRPIFDFMSTKIRPDVTIQAFMFDDDYSFGILQSNAHWLWFTEKASTLKSDYRYTPHSVFDTFPWPQNPTAAQVKAVADAGRALHEYRRQAMQKNPRLTLRDLYRSLEQPGSSPLKDLHAALDEAVLAAYGFPSPKSPPHVMERGSQAAPDGGEVSDVLAQLLALNKMVAARIAAGESVTAPGIPADYPNPAELVSAGCITPPDWA